MKQVQSKGFGWGGVLRLVEGEGSTDFWGKYIGLVF